MIKSLQLEVFRKHWQHAAWFQTNYRDEINLASLQTTLEKTDAAHLVPQAKGDEAIFMIILYDLNLLMFVFPSASQRLSGFVLTFVVMIHPV